MNRERIGRKEPGVVPFLQVTNDPTEIRFFAKACGSDRMRVTMMTCEERIQQRYVRSKNFINKWWGKRFGIM